MIDRDAPWALKVQFTLVVVAFVAIGCAAAWFGSAELVAALRSARSGAATVAFWPASVRGLPLAAAFFALAIMALLPAPAPIGRRRREAARNTAADVLFAAMACCIPLVFVAPPIARSAMSGVMEARGYRLCPPTWERHPSMRWVRAAARCP